jgi:hypothetical protein
MNNKANIVAVAAILTTLGLPGIASAQRESPSNIPNNATYHRLSHPRNGAGASVDQHGVPLPCYSLGPTYERSKARLPKKSRSSDLRRPR